MRPSKGIPRQAKTKVANRRPPARRWGFGHDLLCFVCIALFALYAVAHADAQPLVADGPAISIIVEQRAGSTELYLGGNAQIVLEHLGTDPDLFLNDDGYVPFQQFQSGTWDLGDRLLSGVRVEDQGQPIAFEAMSLMLHPEEIVVPFQDAVAAVMSVSICAVLDPPNDLQLQDATLYAGYIAFHDTPIDDLIASFANLGRSGPEPIDVSVRTFRDGRLVSAFRQTWSEGQPLELVAAQAGQPSLSLSLSAFAVPNALMALLCVAGLIGSVTSMHTHLRPR